MITIYSDTRQGNFKVWKWLTNSGKEFDADLLKTRIKVYGLSEREEEPLFDWIVSNAPKEIAYVEIG